MLPAEQVQLFVAFVGLFKLGFAVGDLFLQFHDAFCVGIDFRLGKFCLKTGNFGFQFLDFIGKCGILALLVVGTLLLFCQIL